MDRPRRESRHHNGITLRGRSQPTFATKSAGCGHEGQGDGVTPKASFRGAKRTRNLEIPGLVLGAKSRFDFVALAPSRNDDHAVRIPITSRAARIPESCAPWAVVKKSGEVASPAKNSRPSTGAASTARLPACPGKACE